MPTELVDSCALNPQRQIWAQRKCGLLKSADFAQCHSEVSVDSFYKRCIFDTCSCDQGGDCECLCTALGAYAYACSAKGIFIRWRTPDLCRKRESLHNGPNAHKFVFDSNAMRSDMLQLPSVHSVVSNRNVRRLAAPSQAATSLQWRCLCRRLQAQGMPRGTSL